MSFEWPLALVALLLVPLMAVGYVLVQRARPRYAARFTNLDLLSNVVRETPQWRRHVPPVLFCAALGLLVVALARPHAVVAVPKETATVMLVTDVSGSMEAEDVAPTRLRAAQEAALAFAEELPEEVNLGLVSFSETAAVRVPPTDDREAIEQGIENLEADGGTAMGDGLATAVDALADVATAPGESEDPPAVIVLLSDGESTVGMTQPLQAAVKARELGVPVFAVALGTDAGTVTQTPPGESFPVTIPVPPDRETLRRIAQITDGESFDALDAERLSTVYENLGSRIGTEEEEREITAGFAAGGAVLLLAGGALSLLWFGRFP
ncbi:MAG TPA: VWA domain-containing protein [Solirubrobacteraceae bacterium]|nr:VWA domain-containing protein [Solirubrobacteraceae bacterium]